MLIAFSLLLLLCFSDALRLTQLTRRCLASDWTCNWECNPFGGRVGNGFGESFESEIAATLLDPEVGYQAFANGRVASLQSKVFEADIVCKGSAPCWEKMISKFPVNFIPNPAVADHLIFGECKLNSDLLVSWIVYEEVQAYRLRKAKEPDTEKSKESTRVGVYKEFGSATPIYEKKCLFINGGQKSVDFISFLRRPKSLDAAELGLTADYTAESLVELKEVNKVSVDKFIAKEKIIEQKWNIFFRSYLSAEWVAEQSIKMEEQSIKMEEQSIKIQEQSNKLQEVTEALKSLKDQFEAYKSNSKT